MSVHKDQKTMESEQRRRFKIHQEFYGQIDIESRIASFKSEMTASTAVIGSGNFNEYYLEVDQQVRDELVADKTINWSPALREILPASLYGGHVLHSFTTLCQIIAGAMWGRGRLVEGGELLLNLLDIAMAEVADQLFKDRWIHQRLRRDQPVSNRDWELIKSVMNKPDSSHSSTDSTHWRPLPIHIFMISNIIRRPIIIYQSTSAGNFSSLDEANNFRGIYLPQLQLSTNCIRNPLVFVYKYNGLFPLLFKENVSSAANQSNAVPLVTASLESLEIKYLRDSEINSGYKLLQEYMDVGEISISSSSRSELVLCARANDMRNFATKLANFATNPAQQQQHKKQQQQQHQQQPMPTRTTSLDQTTASENFVCKTNLSSDLNNATQDFRFVENIAHDTNYRNPQSRCIMDNCRRVGLAEFDGKCRHCFVGQQQPSLSDVSAARRSDVEPSAPSVSILTFNTFQPPEEQDEHCISMIPEPCVTPGCGYMQSARTAPFCYEHAGAGVLHLNEEPNDDVMCISMLDQRCAQPGCKFHASVHTQPFCHEHAANKSSAAADEGNHNIAALERIDEEGLSLMNEKCRNPGCANYISKFTYPMCHDHAMDRAIPVSNPHTSAHHSAPREGPRTGLWTSSFADRASPSRSMRNPATINISGTERLNATERVSTAGINLLEDTSVNDVIRELETRSRQSTGACKSQGCKNFGNSRCRGYCHQCFNALGRSNVS